MQNSVCSDIFWYGDMLLHVWAKKRKFSKCYIQNTWNLWGDEIINSLICIFISTVQEMFRWKLRKFKISYLPNFLSDLHKFFTVLFKMFYSFNWINLNLDRISPLTLTLPSCVKPIELLYVFTRVVNVVRRSTATPLPLPCHPMSWRVKYLFMRPANWALRNISHWFVYC